MEHVSRTVFRTVDGFKGNNLICRVLLSVAAAAALCLSSCDKARVEEGSPYSAEDVGFGTLIQDYLSADYASSIGQVRVTADKVTVTGSYAGNGDFIVAEIPPYMDLLRTSDPLTVFSPESGDFTFEADRFITSGDMTYDRLLSKWAIFERTSSGGLRLVSHARYPDSVQSCLDRPETVLKNKKGLGGVHPNDFISDFDDLDLGSATLNMYITLFTYLTPGSGRIAHEYGGKTYYFDEDYIVNNLDRVLLEARRRDMAVAAILLVQPASSAVDNSLGRLLTDPSCNGGTLIMPNMTSPESVNCFAAVTDFLAQRYCRQDDMYGRVDKWIVLNEVDAASTWANAGTRPMHVLTDYYIKVLRLVYSIVRQYDSNTEVLASFTHSWTALSGDYPVRDMLGIINGMGKAEGDYRWGLAYHTYPWDLLNPRCWECPNSTFSMDTPCVSFRNLEVIDKWIFMPENMYLGSRKRSLWLSEAGINSRSYSDADLEEQAAGTAYAWKKIEAMDGVDAHQWHNWFDNVGDGSGALLGLRKFPDSQYAGAPKPAWHVYQAAGTEREDEVFDRYLEVIGIGDWDIIVDSDEID